MGRYEATTPDDWSGFWTRVRYLEPARVRAAITALVAAAAVWGAQWAPIGDKIGDTWQIVFPLILALQAFIQGDWTRSVVSPSAVNGLTKTTP